MNRVSHRRDELGGLDGLARFSSKHLGVGNQIAIDLSWELDRKLHRSVVEDHSELQLGHGVPPQFG
jgi:hypothetical protein